MRTRTTTLPSGLISSSLHIPTCTPTPRRGTTFVNGVDQSNSQQNFILGSEMNVSINSRNSLLFEFAKALVHQNGPALVGFSVKYDYTWGRGTGRSLIPSGCDESPGLRFTRPTPRATRLVALNY